MQTLARNSEAGNAAFYTLVLLPFCALLSVLSYDLSSYYSLNDFIQSQADRIAAQSALALHSIAHVESSFAASLKQLKETIPTTSGTIQVTAEPRPKVSVTLRAETPLLFSSFLGSRIVLAAERKSVASLAPQDVVLIFPDGETLRPRLDSGNIETPWGNSIDWPPAPYLATLATPPVLVQSSPNLWHQQWTIPALRWATQSCFNPVLSELKSIEQNFVRAVLFSASNRVSVIFTPGNREGFGAEAIRSIHSENNDIGGFVRRNESVRGNWSGYRELETILGDEACILFSSSLANNPPRYSLSDAPSVLQDCASSLHGFPEKGSFQPYDSPLFDKCYLNSKISLEELIHIRSAKLHSIGFDAKPHIDRAIDRALAELLSPAPPTELSQEQFVRGASYTNPSRSIVVVTDSLPALNEVDWLHLISNSAKARARLKLITFQHDGLKPDERTALIQRSDALRNAVHAARDGAISVTFDEAGSLLQLRDILSETEAGFHQAVLER